jgi:SAM-dependent methyltransferase
MNAETMSFPHKFDTIVAGELIEHLTDPAAFLRNARDLLQQEGRLVLSTPYAFGLIHLAYAYLRFPATCSNSQHVYLFCPSTLSNLITRCGFRVLHWELVDDYQFDNTTGKTLAFKYFIIFMRLFRHLLPRKIRSTSMIFVMEALQAESSSIP